MYWRPRWINFGTMGKMFHENNWVEGTHKYHRICQVSPQWKILPVKPIHAGNVEEIITYLE